MPLSCFSFGRRFWAPTGSAEIRHTLTTASNTIRDMFLTGTSPTICEIAGLFGVQDGDAQHPTTRDLLSRSRMYNDSRSRCEHGWRTVNVAHPERKRTGGQASRT